LETWGEVETYVRDILHDHILEFPDAVEQLFQVFALFSGTDGASDFMAVTEQRGT
jgi:hypothetical protein